MHILYTLAGIWGNDSAMRVITWNVGIICALSLFLGFGIRLSPFAGAFAGLTFYSNPSISILSRTAYTDLVVIYLTVTGMLLIMNLFLYSNSWHWKNFVIVNGFLLGVKTNGILMSGALFAVVLHGFRFSPALNSGWKPFLRKACLAGFLVMILGSPWYCWNWMNTGNPIYPYFSQFWNNVPLPDITAFFETFHTYPFPIYGLDMLLDRFGMGKDFLALALLPWNVSIHCHVHDDKWALQYFDGEISFIPLVFIPLIILFSRMEEGKNRFILPLVVLGALFFIWGTGSQQIRFLLPTYSLSILLCAWWLHSHPKFQRLAICVLIIACISGFVFSAQRTARGANFLAGRQTATQFLEEWLPFFKAYAFSRELPGKFKLLPLFEERVYYLSRPFCWLELVPTTFISALQIAKKPEEITMFFRRLNVEYLYVPRHVPFLLKELIQEDNYQKQLHGFFSTQVRSVYKDNQGEILQLNSS